MIKKETLGCIGLLLLISFLGTWVFYTILGVNYHNFSLIDRNKNYSIYVKKLKKNRGDVYINDSLSLGTAYNPTTKEELFHLIEVGDSIKIKAMNDTIYLLKNERTYWFEHQSFK